ncbi:MAG: hypothetical protein JNL67_09835, partial [Planctomycetaceae bacterium]|nr:hypothetical protein [Planctomycetaceae bacterium]
MPSDNSEFENLSQRVTRAVGAGPTPTPPSIDDISLSDRPTHVGPIRPTEALPPSENGRYRDPHEIGRGGMGVVWKVYDSKLERWVAIKRVLPNLENYAEVANRFVTEARALAKLSHPNIVGIFDQ